MPFGGARVLEAREAIAAVVRGGGAVLGLDDRIAGLGGGGGAVLALAVALLLVAALRTRR